MSVHHKKLEPLITAQLYMPTNCTLLMPRRRLKELVGLLTTRINRSYKKTASTEELQAFCFAKVVHICEKACRTNNFNKIESIASHIVALRSLQGKSIYTTVFANITEDQFVNLLSAIQRNINLRSLIDKDAVYLEHRNRLAILESTLEISISQLKAKVAFYRRVLGDRQLQAITVVATDRTLHPIAEALAEYQLPFVEALVVWEIGRRVEEWEKSILIRARKDPQLKKLLETNSGYLLHRTSHELKACVLAVESMRYSSKAKIALVVRVINEGWKRLIDETKYKVPKRLLDAGRFELNASITTSLPYRSITAVSINKGITLFALEKKRIEGFRYVDWHYKAVRIAGWCLDVDTECDVIVSKLVHYIQAKHSYDIHLIVGKQMCIVKNQFLAHLASEIKKTFDIEVSIHFLAEEQDNMDVSASLHIDGDLRLQTLPLENKHARRTFSKNTRMQNLSPTSVSQPTIPVGNEREGFEYTCPSYFDLSKMISEDRWAVTLIGYTQLVIEGIQRGDRFRTIVELNSDRRFRNEISRFTKGGYQYQRAHLIFRELRDNEQISFEVKSKTWTEKSKHLRRFFRGEAGDNSTVHASPLSLFCRVSRFSRQDKVYKIEDAELQKIFETNENLFFDLFDKALKYEVEQLEDDHFNPFTGSEFIDTVRIIDRLEKPSTDLGSNISFFGTALWNDIGTYFLGTSNPSRHLENKGSQDKDAINFRKEMLKAGRSVEYCPYYECRQLMLSMKKYVQLIELQKVPNQTFMTFVDEKDWLELTQHVVLVHAVQPDRLCNLFPEEFDWTQVGASYNCLFAIKKMLTQDGVLGSNLDSKHRQFRGPLNFHPHIHRSWNQLVQRHTFVTWDDSLIAILEPLGSFEDSPQHHSALGIAPYDTFTIGSHQLSANSTIIVPDIIEVEVRQYLTGFRGKIVSYNLKENHFPLREEIFNAIQRYYPETWHLVDHKSGHKIGAESQLTPSGYSEITCVEKRNGDRIILISQEGRQEGQLKATAIKKAVKSGKYLGIHNNCVTYWLEDRSQVFSQNLKPFKKNPTSIIGNPLFAGYVAEGGLAKLLVLKSLEFQEKMHQFSPETGAGEVGDYILKESIYADMMSLLYCESSDSPHFFTPYELHLMISQHEQIFKKILIQLALAVKHQEPPLGFFQSYTALLKHVMGSMFEAKAALVKTLEEDVVTKTLDIDLILNKILLQEEWTAVQMSFDFENRWPLAPAEHAFLLSIREAFGSDMETFNLALKEVKKRILINEVEYKEKLVCIEYVLRMFLKEIYYKDIIKSYSRNIK